MPNLQNLVLKDRAATPVNHTFTPRGISSDGVASVAESSGVPIGNNTYSISLRTTPDGRYKGTAKLAVPIVQTQTINGISTPVVVRVARATLTLDYDKASTTQERKDIVGMLADSLDPAKTLVNSVLVDLEGVY